ncbi:SusD/RagB family nutrient-binding outer membrane lipoprotein [Galbibacter mesophilus]|uniref:SusD/RagB family nutrient-binding outer membrane lipoprotein n=1 Tax=Galbibacter mesophilus TaxID=379069 RepID=UPI00191C9B53|nr:SusD/RagB family nutrient-binding outer membrane lipoprotein [Galbibacter mesophilus]MCM5661737.1 SusD/RagB family nutrient-binding outer membrane lipoprotein [Galbibacter mesophilus]
MKTFKYKLIAVATLCFGAVSCDTDYISDPDNPEVAPTTQLVNNSQFDLAFNLNDQWLAGRGTLGFSQYWGGTFYTDENRYQLRVSQINDFWNDPYRILTDLKEVIRLNEDPATADLMSAYGDNNNQIQAARIMMAYAFSKLVDTFGPVPYWSYGQKDNADFQALRLDEGINSPKYTSDEVIYDDLLNELQQAANMMDLSKTVFTEGDTFCNGDAAKWVKFAHSLRLRLAAHLNSVNPTLAQQVYAESADKALMSNSDNISFTFGTDDLTGGPWHDAFTVGARRDFAPTVSLMDLMYNRVGPFSSINDEDPRVDQFFDTRNDTDAIIGVPYGFGDTPARNVIDEGIPDVEIIKPDFVQPIIEFAEIEFIRSEFEGWDQTHYLNGVEASMERWGVASSDASSYISALPAATEETVLTQKYLALYMDGMESWTEYRRTGFPMTLSVPGDTYDYEVENEDGTTQTVTATFTTLIPGLNEIPSRVTYPQNEQLLNKANWEEARNTLSDGDQMFSKIFWDIN